MKNRKFWPSQSEDWALWSQKKDFPFGSELFHDYASPHPKICWIIIGELYNKKQFKEQRPDSIVSLQRNLPVFIRDFKVFFDGCIIVAEQSEKVTEQNNTKQYFAELYNRVEIEARLNVSGIQSVANAFVAPFKGEIGLVICKSDFYLLQQRINAYWFIDRTGN